MLHPIASFRPANTAIGNLGHQGSGAGHIFKVASGCGARCTHGAAYFLCTPGLAVGNDLTNPVQRNYINAFGQSVMAVVAIFAAVAREQGVYFVLT